MYGVCKSDSRYPERLAEKDVHFIPFPKPLRNRVKCERWIRACGRPDLNVEKVTKYSYICSLHFVRGNGPTEEYPDPIPAGACEAEKENFMLQNRKRRAPIDRPSLVCRKVKKPGRGIILKTDEVWKMEWHCSSNLKWIELKRKDRENLGLSVRYRLILDRNSVVPVNSSKI
ncbi:unnamed protein product [Mytilus edulis]|uniref:THAP-type domain-containing protein n=1 Tax=Mytilus edulis TaxID=6550 RepID=A0A8S3TJY1_MYTED|nr:unnamed protein product [Mytilus edulis]